MTRLLISVRDAAEATAALAGGADLIDVKEPSRGPLGAADAAALAAVVKAVGGRAPVSAALGELAERNQIPPTLAGEIAYAKFGLAGCAHQRDWPSVWQRANAALPREVMPVAVCYADWQTAAAPSPGDVLAKAVTLGCGAALLDTFDKSAGSLVEQLSRIELERWISTVRDAGMVCVVAGGLRHEELAKILPLEPDYVGVRGAVCRDGRTTALDGQLVSQLAQQLRGRRATSQIA